jgi:hypothetical protein
MWYIVTHHIVTTHRQRLIFLLHTGYYQELSVNEFSGVVSWKSSNF